MTSPFPGMDPYIESSGLWADFHDDLVTEIKRTLARQVPPGYVVRTGERAYVQLVDLEGKREHPFKPDVSLSHPRPALPQSGSPAPVAVAPAAEVVEMRPLVTEEFRERFVEVYYQADVLQLVTCIEVLSPSNKRKGSESWEQYLRKRQALLMGQANLVEIDLLRGGEKFPMLDPWPIDCPYTLLVWRRSRAPSCQVYKGFSLRPLPAVPIPLTTPDPDISLALQPMIEGIYGWSSYHVSIDYTKPCPFALSGEETTWLQERLRAPSTKDRDTDDTDTTTDQHG